MQLNKLPLIIVITLKLSIKLIKDRNNGYRFITSNNIRYFPLPFIDNQSFSANF